MSDYTPTEDELRGEFHGLEAEFDRAVAKIKADAWQEGWDAGAGWPQDDTNPYKAAS